MPEHYIHRFRKRLYKELGEFVKTQLLVGFILTGVILWWQVHTGIITKPNIRANVSSFLWPYLVVLGLFTIYHLGRTAVLLDRESQSRITELEGAQQGAGIVGYADLMVQELDISDLAIAPDLSSYEVNLGAFARIEVASTDKPRTIKHFEIEMTAPDGTQYKAKSEHDLGNYDYKHDVTRKDIWGFATVESVREPMEDLAAKVRVPIQPYTHVSRAWVRFEIPHVKQGHEPHNCTIRIFSVDPIGVRYEIKTDEMQVRTIDADEYAVAKGQ